MEGPLLATLISPATLGEPQDSIELCISPVATEIDAAVLTTSRLVDASIAIGYQGSVALTGSLVTLRGNTVIKAGTILASGFPYGVQGKLTVQGSLTSSNWGAGLVGQLDLSAGHHTGGGWLASIWGDWGATALDASDANAAALLLTNTTADKILAAIYIDTNSTYFLAGTDEGGGHGAGNWLITASIGTYSGKRLKCQFGGADYYLPLYSVT